MSRSLKFAPKSEGTRFASTPGTRLRAAAGTPQSYDPKTRTFDFVLASERPCRTWRVDENRREVVEVDEILPMSALVDLDDFVGKAVLEDHRYWSPPIGVIESARIEGDKLVCRGRLSKRPDVDVIAQDVQDGIRRSFSVGFEILTDGVAEIRAGDVPLIRVVKWRAKEASLVSVPADDTATIRSGKSRLRSSTTLTGARTAMTSEELKAFIAETRSANEKMLAALEAFAETGDDGDDDTDLAAEAEVAAEAARAAVLAKRGAPKTPQAPAAPTERSAQEKATILAVRTAFKRHGGDVAAFDALDAAGEPVEELRAQLRKALTTSKAEPANTTPAPEGERAGLVTADKSKKTARSAASK